MLRVWKIREIFKEKVPKKVWISLIEIYRIIEQNVELDDEDWNPSAPNNNEPKWKRNVRNLLQKMKTNGEIEWDGNANYKF